MTLVGGGVRVQRQAAASSRARSIHGVCVCGNIPCIVWTVSAHAGEAAGLGTQTWQSYE